MEIFVTVKAGARNERIKKISETEFTAFVKEPAKEGKANKAVQGALAEYFNIAPSRVRLVSGARSKQKKFTVG